MGFETFGFGFGREDVWEPEEIFWGSEDAWLGDERYSGDRELADPLGAVQMGLIYVNPEGPNGEPDPVAAARDIRDTFARMAMNDEETVALIAGGHSFGKTHGAGDPDLVGPEPEGCPVEHQGIGWKSQYGTGKGRDAITSGLEVTWTQTPTQWSNKFFENLFGFEWELTKSPAGAHQWQPKDGAGANTVPDPEDGSLTRPPTMLTTDLALRFDPEYEKISRRFLEHPDEFALAFAKAWYKLLHRDMGPVERYLGPWVPEPQPWQDPVPPVEGELVVRRRRRRAQGGDPRHRADRAAAGPHRVGVGIAASAAPTSAAGPTAPASAWSRSAAGSPTTPPSSTPCSRPLEQVKADFDASGGATVSLADLIVLGGSAAVEKAARDAGHEVTVPFHPGRTDATQEQTDVDSFRVLQPRADGFRSYLPPGEKLSPETLLLDRANLLNLTAPEMTVLVGGMRAIGANVGDSDLGVLTERRGQLTNDFFRTLLAPGTEWKSSTDAGERLRRHRPGHRPGEVDRHRGRPRLRLALPAAGAVGGLRQRRRAGEVRARLRRRLGQGHGARPVRPAPLTRSRRARRSPRPTGSGGTVASGAEPADGRLGYSSPRSVNERSRSPVNHSDAGGDQQRGHDRVGEADGRGILDGGADLAGDGAPPRPDRQPAHADEDRAEHALPDEHEEQPDDDRVPGERREGEEERGVDRARHGRADGQGPGPPGLRRVEHQGRERHRQRAEQHRGAPRGGELAARDDVPVHRLREQVDHRAVVDLGAEHGRRGEQGDERQRQREPEPDHGLEPDLVVGEQPHQQGQHEEGGRDEHEHDAPPAPEEGLRRQAQQGAVHRGAPTR